MKRRHPNSERWLTEVKDARLRLLVYQALDLRGQPDYDKALRAIEDWQWQTAPERLERHAEGGGGA